MFTCNETPKQIGVSAQRRIISSGYPTAATTGVRVFLSDVPRMLLYNDYLFRIGGGSVSSASDVCSKVSTGVDTLAYWNNLNLQGLMLSQFTIDSLLTHIQLMSFALPMVPLHLRFVS